MRKICLVALISLLPFSAHAEVGCTLIVSYPQAQVLHESGNCDQRRSPASTFKIPLALMGFDSGILEDTHTPRWEPTTLYGPVAERERQDADAEIWLKDSIIWFSRKITDTLGSARFQNYMKLLHYGNMDVSGTPGRNNGLTHSWLFNSLKITPREQVQFIQAMLKHELSVSAHAHEMTIASMPGFTAGDWQVFGKTGSGWLRDTNGEINMNRPQGWFVGWARNGNRQIVFARLLLRHQPIEGYAGMMARDTFLQELPQLVPDRNGAP